MRAVLRTIAQCHANKILHRDVKPGNFMLLEDDPLSPVKAIGQSPYSIAQSVNFFWMTLPLKAGVTARDLESEEGLLALLY